jgi:hypothetical protein
VRRREVVLVWKGSMKSATRSGEARKAIYQVIGENTGKLRGS